MTLMVNEFADLDVLVVFITNGTGCFNTDPRRLGGLLTKLPEELTDPSLTVFNSVQEHYGFCKLGKSQINYMDFLKEGVPLICLTVKALQGPSGQIQPIDNTLPSDVGTDKQRGLFALKSDLHITGNVVDLICYNKDEVSYTELF